MRSAAAVDAEEVVVEASGGGSGEGSGGGSSGRQRPLVHVRCAEESRGIKGSHALNSAVLGTAIPASPAVVGASAAAKDRSRCSSRAVHTALGLSTRLPSTALPGTPAGDEGGGIEGGGPEGGGIAGEAEVRQAASSGAANTTRRASVHATACRHPSKAVGAASTLRTALEAPTSALGSRGRAQRTRSIRRMSTEGASRCSERTATRNASSTSRF